MTITIKEETELQLQNIDLTISEDGEPQTIISIRGIGTNSPITLAVLIQEDLPSVGNEIKSLRISSGICRRVRALWWGTCERALCKLSKDSPTISRKRRRRYGHRRVSPTPVLIILMLKIEALKRFESQPLGRRAILLVSDGLDTASRLSIADSERRFAACSK